MERRTWLIESQKTLLVQNCFVIRQLTHNLFLYEQTKDNLSSKGIDLWQAFSIEGVD